MTRIDRVTTAGTLGNHETRLRLSEFSGERWIYFGTVGVDGIDDLITPDSPPFQNGWTQAGGDTQAFSFVLRANGWLFTRGVPTGGADNTVVATLPVECRPKKTEPFTSRGRTPGSVVTWRIEPTGEVIYETQIGGGSGGGGSGSGFIQFDVDNDGDWLQINATGYGGDLQVGGPYGISGSWSFALNGTNGSAIGDENQLWIVSTSLFIHSDSAFGGYIDINSYDGTTYVRGGGASLSLYSDYIQAGCDGFEIDSNGVFGGGLFFYSAGNQGITLQDTGAYVDISSDTAVTVRTSAGGDIDIRTGIAGTSGSMELRSKAITIASDGNSGGNIAVGAPLISFSINNPAGGSVLRVSDPVGGGSGTIFEVRQDGSIHGKASIGAIIWDL